MSHLCHQIERMSPVSVPVQTPKGVIPKPGEGSTSNIIKRAGNKIFRTHAVGAQLRSAQDDTEVCVFPGPIELIADRSTDIPSNQVEQVDSSSPLHGHAYVCGWGQAPPATNTSTPTSFAPSPTSQPPVSRAMALRYVSSGSYSSSPVTSRTRASFGTVISRARSRPIVRMLSSSARSD